MIVNPMSPKERYNNPNLTISDALQGKRSGTVGILTQGNQTFKVSLRPDVSEIGTYSVVLTGSGGGSESYRMKYKGGKPLEEALKDFEYYINLDTNEKVKVQVALPEARASESSASKSAKDISEYDRKLKELKAIRYKTGPQEQQIKLMESAPKDWRTRWRVGDGISFPVAYGRGLSQSRGWAIRSIQGENAVLEVVRDVGQTSTGSDDPGYGHQVVIPLWQLKRDSASDVRRNPIWHKTVTVTPDIAYTWSLLRKIRHLEQSGIDGKTLSRAKQDFALAYRNLSKEDRIDLMQHVQDGRLHNPAKFSITDYPIISAYINGRIPALWKQQTDRLIQEQPKMSPIQAGNYAAAMILKLYGPETAKIESFVRSHDVDAANELYDSWQAAMDEQTLAHLLIELSGSRTLLTDMDKIQVDRNPTKPEPAYAPCPACLKVMNVRHGSKTVTCKHCGARLGVER